MPKPKMNLEYFGESSGCLHLITTCMPIITQFTIYENETQRDKLDWFVKYNGDLNFVTLKFPKMEGGRTVKIVYHPLCLVEGGKSFASNT